MVKRVQSHGMINMKHLKCLKFKCPGVVRNARHPRRPRRPSNCLKLKGPKCKTSETSGMPECRCVTRKEVKRVCKMMITDRSGDQRGSGRDISSQLKM